MNLTSKWIAIIVVVTLFGGIAITSLLGWWTTETTKVPAKFAEGEAAGEYNPADIRGSYTFGDIATTFDLPVLVLQKAFQITDANPEAFALKNLEEIYANLPNEVGTDSVRLFVAWFKVLPYTPDETYIPVPAVEILKNRGVLNADQLAYLETHAVHLDGSVPVQPATPSTVASSDPNAQPSPTHLPANAITGSITGKTTFQNLLDWGVAASDIEKVINADLPASSMSIKDYVGAQGLEFSTVKTALQALVDAAK